MANWLKKLNDAGNETVQKVKDSAEISKINAAIQKELSNQEKIFSLM